MVKIMSFYEYNQRWKKLPLSIDAVFQGSYPQVLELLHSSIHRPSIESIIDAIDGCKLKNDEVVSKFDQDSVLSLLELSDGCKTAILAYLQSFEDESTLLNLTGCGPVALSACLDIMDGTEIIGLVGVPLDIEGDYCQHDLEVDGEYSDNWFAAYAAGAKMLGMD